MTQSQILDIFQSQKALIVNTYDTVSDPGYILVSKSVIQKFFTSRCPTVLQNMSKSLSVPEF